VVAETEEDIIKRLNNWKDFMKNRGMRVNINKTKVVISGEWQKVTQKAVRWPCGVCGRDVGNNSIQCPSFLPSFLPSVFCCIACSQYSVLVVRSGYTGNVVI